MPDSISHADLTERARAIRRKIRQKFESEDPTWRSAVSRYSLTEKKADEFLAAALQSEREAAAAEARRTAIAEITRWWAYTRYEDKTLANLLTALASPPAPQEDKR